MDFASQVHRDKLKLGIQDSIFLLPVARHPGVEVPRKPILSPTTDPVASQVPKNSNGLEYGEGQCYEHY